MKNYIGENMQGV